MPTKHNQSSSFASGVAFMFSITFFVMGIGGILAGSDGLGGIYVSGAYGAYLLSSRA